MLTTEERAELKKLAGLALKPVDSEWVREFVRFFGLDMSKADPFKAIISLFAFTWVIRKLWRDERW